MTIEPDPNGIPKLTTVRPGHEFDEQALQRYLSTLFGETAALGVRQFEGGQSNPTFILDYGGKSYVLRKQPPGELLPSAHQVSREYRVMDALAETPVPVPKVYALCEDKSVIGTHFYIMEHVPGRVFADPLLPTLDPSQRLAIYHHMIDILAALHQVDCVAVGLESFGRPGNYYARQINRWSKQYVASRTEHLEEMEYLMKWLPENIPDVGPTVVAHGDYRLGNMIVHPTEPRIVAILDWEISTLGDALADLSYMCMDYHAEPGEGLAIGPELEKLGIPSEQEQIDRYCSLTGRSSGIDNWKFYLVYNMFRGAAIIQGVYKRGLDGNASSQMALDYADACPKRSRLGYSILHS